MACGDLSAGRARICKQSLGGNSKLYLWNWSSEDASFTYANGEATAIDAGLTTVYGFLLEGDGGILSESIVGDRNSGTAVNTQTLNVVLKKIDATTSAEMSQLAYGFPQAAVKDRNGIYHLIGLDDGIDFTIEQTTGGAKGDLNGYNLTGVATMGALGPKMDSSTVTAFEALVTP